MRNFSLVVWTVFLFSLDRSDLLAQTTVIIGNCNVVTSASSGPIPNTGADIGCPQDPKKTIRVAYYWLDSTAYSLLIAGELDNRLSSLLGERPILIQNELSTYLQKMITDFGSVIDQSSAFNGDVYSIQIDGGTKTTQLPDRNFKTLPQRVTKRVKVYDAYDTIFMPDIAAIKTVYNTLRWPDDYKMYYIDTSNMDTMSIDGTGRERIGDAIFNSTVNWRYVPKQEIETFASSIAPFKEAASKQPEIVYLPTSVSGGVKIDSLEAVSRSKSLAAIKFLGSSRKKVGERLATCRSRPSLSRTFLGFRWAENLSRFRA